MKARVSITENEAYAIDSAISELESLMEGTLDEDYKAGTKKIVNALKRVLKKYQNNAR
ncbi:MAG: hypothetical protein Q4F07_07600 [Bacteroidales bacterium]|nr:hypothetical protein [Bacteroidales bacterium]